MKVLIVADDFDHPPLDIKKMAPDIHYPAQSPTVGMISNGESTKRATNNPVDMPPPSQIKLKPVQSEVTKLCRQITDENESFINTNGGPSTKWKKIWKLIAGMYEWTLLLLLVFVNR